MQLPILIKKQPMRILLFLILLNFAIVNGQNTYALEEGQKSPNASIQLVSFMEGHWLGEAFGGKTEEIWSPIDAGAMAFVFRHIADGKITFYEIGHIREIDKTLIFELRHFDANLHAWEEKNEVQQFKFVKAEANRVYFECFTFENVSENEINIYGLIKDEKGDAEEVVFNYKKS